MELKLNNDIIIKIRTKGKRLVNTNSKILPWGMNWRYYLEVEYEGVKFNFTWNDSIHEWQVGHDTMTEDKYRDAVYCAIMDAFDYGQNDFESFCGEFGYALETVKEERAARKIYNACGELYDKFSRIMSEEEMCDFINTYNE